MTLLMVSKKTLTTMKKIVFSIAAVAAMFASCSQDADLEIVDNGAKAEAITSVNASSESGTRAVVDGTSIKWQTGDELGVLGTNASSVAKNIAYTLSSGDGTTTGTFSNGSSDITTISATMYPYQEGAIWDAINSKLTLEIPSVQTGVKDSFDPNAAIMYAFGSSTNQALKLAVNFLKVTIGEGETNVHSITISSTTTVLSGKMEVTSSSVTPASEGTKSVTLTAGANQCFVAGDYYIAVKAGDIANPSISYVYYNTSDHTATEKTKAGTSTLEFDGKNVRKITADLSSGTTTRKAVQLWANGPYFAEENVGATSATELGTKMSFAAATAENFTWGANWCTPSKNNLEHLMTAAKGQTNEMVKCEYTQEGSTYGFRFTGIGNYASNSVFFPVQECDSHYGRAYYWSGTADGSKAWRMYLYYSDGNWLSDWNSSSQSYYCLVRPVLKN